MMSSFLARSFRRTLHARLEENIIRNLSAGQNLEYVNDLHWQPSLTFHPILTRFSFYVKDWTWEDLQDAGSIIDEDVSDNEDTEEEKALGPQSFDEKHALVEEFAVHLPGTKLVVSGLNEGDKDWPVK
jgi:vacuolar protein sorting-associated protein 3